jgi:hypothetical protein
MTAAAAAGLVAEVLAGATASTTAGTETAPAAARFEAAAITATGTITEIAFRLKATTISAATAWTIRTIKAAALWRDVFVEHGFGQGRTMHRTAIGPDNADLRAFRAFDSHLHAA